MPICRNNPYLSTYNVAGSIQPTCRPEISKSPASFFSSGIYGMEKRQLAISMRNTKLPPIEGILLFLLSIQAININMHSSQPRLSEKDLLRLQKYWMQNGDIIFAVYVQKRISSGYGETKLKNRSL